jgi:hypothetical protein
VTLPKFINKDTKWERRWEYKRREPKSKLNAIKIVED